MIACISDQRILHGFSPVAAHFWSILIHRLFQIYIYIHIYRKWLFALGTRSLDVGIINFDVFSELSNDSVVRLPRPPHFFCCRWRFSCLTIEVCHPMCCRGNKQHNGSNVLDWFFPLLLDDDRFCFFDCY